MSNDLNTILDSASNRALVEKYLLKKFLERRDYATVLANSKFGQRFKLPEESGQYVEATRKNRFRMPQHLSESNPTSDPASGATMGVEKVKFPIEFLQEYVGVGTTAQLTSWIDLKEWADEDLPMALQRRCHQLVQNAFAVGRYQPGVWAADGTASTAFDTTAQATPTLYGVSFTFSPAPKFYANGKTAFNSLDENDRAKWSDLERIKNAIALAGGPKIDGMLVAVMSESMASDLMKDDKYFETMVHAFKGEGLVKGHIADYKGFHCIMDDEPMTEDFAAEGVRATNGQVHSCQIFGKGAFGYLDLGGKNTPNPKFKVQDISKTGVEKTIGYLWPFQAAIVNTAWCAVYKAPVSDYEPNA